MGDVRPLSQRLREDTRELHTRAEKAPLQADLVQGKLPRDRFEAMLGQLYVLHRWLDARLEGFLASQPEFGALIDEAQLQTPYLVEDLRHFGHSDEAIEGSVPTEATAAAIARLNALVETDARALVGIHYVLEGANNGNRFIARVVSKVYGLEPGGAGLRYLDPYGEAQGPRWQAFREQIDQYDWSESDMDMLVRAAAETFQAIIDLHESVEAAPVEPSVRGTDALTPR